jgi:hypothetical protein
MAQPSAQTIGVSARYRIYLSSSPIICLADALSALVRLVTISLYFKTSPLKASHLVVFEWSATVTSGEEEEKEPQNHTWPRWLFFVMGPLPAAIKLASFTGLPWTKTWGMIFASSFLVIEFITLLSRSNVSELNETVLKMMGLWDRTTNAPVEPEKIDEATCQSYKYISKRLNIFDRILFALSQLSHGALLVWAVNKLWMPALSSLCYSNLFDWIADVFKCIMALLFLLSLMFHVVLRCAKCSLTIINPVVVRTFQVFFVSTLFLPQKEQTCALAEANPSSSFIPPPPNWLWLSRWASACRVWFYLFALHYICWKGMERIIKRWPGVARALLIQPKTREEKEAEIPQAGEQHDEGYVEGLDFERWRAQGVRQRMQELRAEARAVVVGSPLKDDLLVDDGAWFSLVLFLMTLVVCVLWYGFIYDSTGTINPSWTDVFG